MSTRGCVAIGTPKAWRGVYNHYDSYPTGLGKILWDHLSGRNLKDFAKELLNYDDWRSYLNKGICEYCGKKTTQPHSISGVIIHHGGPGPYPDPSVRYHKHEKYNNITDSQMTHKDADPLFIEWVYVIDPQKEEFHVLAGDYKSGCHKHQGTYKLSSNEPHWEGIHR